MFIKLLLISQLLALSYAQLSLDEAKKQIDASVYSDEETTDATHLPEPHLPPQYQPHHPHKKVTTSTPEPETTTPKPEPTTTPAIQQKGDATVAPDDGLGQLDDGLLQNNDGSALPESTTPEPETTSTTTTTTTTTTTPKPHKHEHHPHPHSHPYPYPIQYPYSHPGLIFSAAGPKLPPPSATPPTPKDADKESPESSRYPSYPNFRSPYSPYQPPVFNQPRNWPSFPGYGPPSPGYGYPHNHDHDHEEDSGEDKHKDKSGEADTDEDVALKPPGFGYPQVYLIPRRPVISVPSFPRPGGGYGSPYGYGRY
ncbi:soluble scavenger receptor cysteine-rich domain-containing protein SSC5D [Drosophila santomea]|uniref:soluble scavenger receptor cysteine-rich domain-containing protein SSC5D n=1 Tax=Drosophila santomea TaxID=129105 RepID=UPI001952DEAF|nr:soluble scavenger receptor cysteine-rich domain-containing protein SSC5D [Drosophila santomea]